MLYGIEKEVLLSRLPRVVDNTMLASFRTCNHKFLWEFAVGLAPGFLNINLHAGGCFATALESLYSSLFIDDKPLDFALAKSQLAFEKAWGTYVPNVPTKKSKQRVWDSVVSYAEHYRAKLDYIQPSLAFANPFEYSFAIPLEEIAFGVDFPMHPVTNEPFIYAGRFDMIGEQQGLIRIRDDKLVSSLGPTWDGSWTLRSQLIGYVACMQILGYDLDTVEVRGTCPLVNSIEHRSAVKTYSREVIERWKRQIARDLRNLIHAVTEEDWGHNFDQACNAYGGCSYMDLCRSTEPQAYFGTFAARTWNPLERTS